MFDLRHWLSATDLSGADDSLDDDAAQLLVLNDSLLDDVSGPILASLIVSVEHSHGLGAFEELARGSEPRFIAMALLNILYVLREGRARDCDFLYNPNSNEPSQEITISGSDLPSEKTVRARVASIMPRISCVFLEKVSQGDFCPDFLTYLLTILMDLSKDCETSPDVFSYLANVQSRSFLKEIIRVWKNSDYSSHVSTTEKEEADELNLGFLVSCYLRCICITALSAHENAFSKHRTVRDETGDEAVADIYGVDALIALDDWFIKFAVMRIYQSFSNLTEREYLLSVLYECAARQASFVQRLLELQFGSTVLHCLKQHNEIVQFPRQSILPLTCSRDVKSLWQYFHVIRKLSEQFHFRGSSSGPSSAMCRPMDIWFGNFWDALIILCRRSVTLLIGTDFETSDSGRFLRKSVSSLILQANSLAWTVRTSYISFFPGHTRQVRVDAKYNDWISRVYAAITSCCAAQGSSWGSLSARACLAAVRCSLAVCRSVLEQGRAPYLCANRTDIDTKDRKLTEWNRFDKLCEWCLECNVNTKMCGTCQRVWYCSSKHQRMHWEAGHKTECQFVRNSLEGCSFNLEEDGRINGLVSLKEQGKVSCGNWNIEDAGLQGRVKAQKGELELLGFRLPGLFLEVCNDENEKVEVWYICRGKFVSEMKKMMDDFNADERRHILIACMKNCGKDCRMQMTETLVPPTRQLWVHFRGYDESHSLMIKVA